MITELTFMESEMDLLDRTAKEMNLSYDVVRSNDGINTVAIEHEFPHMLYYFGAAISNNRKNDFIEWLDNLK